ncbi:MAG: flagellar export protein FliJ [Thermovirgaceae bacterium]
MTTNKRVERLEKLKDIRDRLQDEAKGRLTNAQKRKETLITQSGTLGSTWRSVLCDFKERSRRGELTPEELWYLRNGMDSLEEEMSEVDRAIEETERELDTLQQELRQKHTEAKLVENVIVERKKEIRRDREKSEQKELDDLVCMVYTK